ncbi:hypothetical protein ACQKCU_25005 [Heyndrickxia sporothermodurans]
MAKTDWTLDDVILPEDFNQIGKEINGKAENTLATQTKDGLQNKDDKKKLDGIESGANKYVHPASHAPSIIVQDVNNRFVTDNQIKDWNSKETIIGAQTKADKAKEEAINFAKSFGIGATAIKNISGKDLNELTETGLYVGNNLTNSPSTVSYYYVLHLNWTGTTRLQVLFRNSPTAYDEMWIRSGSNSWKQIASAEVAQMFKLTDDNGYCISLPTKTDIKTITKSGLYAGNQLVNMQNNDQSWYRIIIFASSSSSRGYIAQRSDGRIWFATMNAGVWIDWKEIADASLTQMFKLTQDTGFAKRLPENTTKLFGLEAGYYYITTAETANLTDHPEPNVAGWFLMANSGIDSNSATQVLIKNSTTKQTIYYRIYYNQTTGIGKWIKIANFDEAQMYKLTDDKGQRTRAPKGALEALPTGFYYGSGAEYSDSPMSTDASWYVFNIFVSDNGMKQIEARRSFDNRYWTKTIHNDGSTRGWKEIPSLADMTIGTDWKIPTLLNGYTKGNEDEPCRYKKVGNELHLQITAYGTANGTKTPVAILPAEYRPEYSLYPAFTLIGLYKPARGFVLKDGSVGLSSMISEISGMTGVMMHTVIPLK